MPGRARQVGLLASDGQLHVASGPIPAADDRVDPVLPQRPEAVKYDDGEPSSLDCYRHQLVDAF
jgi:hypothetical protein